MKNLERIKKAWAMGWSAKFYWKTELKEFRVLYINKYKLIAHCEQTGKLVESDLFFTKHIKDINKNFNVKGYLYGAELCVGETIPRDQKFRIKATGEIAEFGYHESKYHNLFDDYKPQELEPVFV